MKKYLLFIILITSLFTSTTFAQRKGTLTVNARFAGIMDGYDLMNKTVVYVDGEVSGETSEQPQSKPNMCKVQVTRGKHTIRIVNMARNNGQWEEHTYKNNYSIDAFYEKRLKIKKQLTVNLIFDINEEKTFVTLN